MQREEEGAGRRSDPDKSFVKKVKSRVSGFIPSSLTKWFGSTNEGPKIRHREHLEEEDDEVRTLQPPAKRVKQDEPNFASTPLHLTYSSLNAATAGPSGGLKTRKLVLPDVKQPEQHGGSHNGDKDSDSGDESTSGYSSMPRIPSKEQVSDLGESSKGCLTPSKSSNRSLFGTPAVNERSLFGSNHTHSPVERLNTSLSSRRPGFNTSAFRSPNFMDRTLSTKRIIDSPFYGGRTAYGGASAYSRNAMKPAKEPDSESCLRNFVRAKPADVKHTTLSKTARRILSTLEQYADPGEDVKKIPNPGSRRTVPQRPYSVPNRELMVPTTVSDLLKMKMREQLQDSTVSVREMAATSKSSLNAVEYKIRDEETPALPKSTNKIKTKITSLRPKATDSDEAPPPVVLPDVQLPISTLPSFDFTIPAPAAEKKTTIPSKPVEMKPQSSSKPPPPKKEAASLEFQFKFAKPLVLAENLKSIKAINNFKFSEPVNKRRQGEMFKAGGGPKKIARKNNGENGVPFPTPAKELLTSGSVMDVLGKKNDLLDKFKPAEGTWECKMCMIRNTADKKKCLACETPKESESATKPSPIVSANSFGDKFKISSGQWECPVCMIRNDPDKSKCVACETPKQQPQAAPAKPALVNNCKGFGEKFILGSTDKWECSVCMVRNDPGQNTCVACTTARKLPGLSTGKWECSVCLVRNDQDKSRCVACENPKPGGEVSLAATTTKKPSADWECSACLVRNPESKLKCVCCETAKPGSAVVAAQSTSNFKFGIDLTTQTNGGHGFTFGIKPDMKEPAKTASTGFTFGTKTPQPSEQPASFSFGVPAAAADTPKSETKALPVNGDVKGSTDKPASGFSFGAKAEAEKKAPEVNKPSTTFTFGTESKPSTSESKPAPAITFGTESKKPSTTLTFGTESKQSSSTPAFGTESKQPSSTLTFGTENKQPSSTLAFGAESKQPLSTLTFGTETKPSPKMTFGTENKPLTFGATTQLNTTSTTATTTTPSFGSPAEKKPTFTFSAPAKSDTTAPAATPLFTFGTAASKPPQTAAAPEFKFNSNNSTTFNFSSSSNTTTTTAAGGFSFSASTNAPLATFGGTPAAPSLSFGAPAASSFGGQPQQQQPTQNGVFNFGGSAAAASTTPKTGFNFGASPAAPASGGFNFGASSNNTQSAGGFKFSAPSATPQFNADIKPTFNFTSGLAPNAFTAQPTGETPKPTRVIRRALRRTQQR